MYREIKNGDAELVGRAGRRVALWTTLRACPGPREDQQGCGESATRADVPADAADEALHPEQPAGRTDDASAEPTVGLRALASTGGDANCGFGDGSGDVTQDSTSCGPRGAGAPWSRRGQGPQHASTGAPLPSRVRRGPPGYGLPSPSRSRSKRTPGWHERLGAFGPPAPQHGAA